MSETVTIDYKSCQRNAFTNFTIITDWDLKEEITLAIECDNVQLFRAVTALFTGNQSTIPCLESIGICILR
jgi:hypothetical protein